MDQSIEEQCQSAMIAAQHLNTCLEKIYELCLPEIKPVKLEIVEDSE